MTDRSRISERALGSKQATNCMKQGGKGTESLKRRHKMGRGKRQGANKACFQANAETWKFGMINQRQMDKRMVDSSDGKRKKGGGK